MNLVDPGRRYGPDTKSGQTDGRTDRSMDVQTDRQDQTLIGRGLIGQNHLNCILHGLFLRERGSLLNATNLHWYASYCS